MTVRSFFTLVVLHNYSPSIDSIPPVLIIIVPKRLEGLEKRPMAEKERALWGGGFSQAYHFRICG
jgi:hypothetical protein